MDKVKDFFKKYGWIIAVLVIIGFVIFFLIKGSNSEPVKTSSELAQDSLSTVIAGLQNDLSNKNNELDEYKAKLDTCENNIQRPLTLEERLANAENELANLKNKPAPAPIVRYVPAKVKAKKTPKRDVAETKFQTASFVMPATRSEVVVSNDNSVSNTIYEGEIKGDVGLTINPSRHLIYFVKSTVLTGKEFYVNGDQNKKMSLNGSYWYYIDPRILSDWEIANSVILWNVKEGLVNWGGGSYQAWFPHETIKSLINSVRGFEYGKITNDDLNQMSQRDSHIWSPNNPNGIYQPLPGINKERTDQNFWHGWNIRTKISYKKVTQ